MKDAQSSEKKRWNPLRVLLLLISAAVIGLSVYSFQAEHIAGNPLPMPLGCGVASVLSGSMEPELSTGDIVLVHETQDISVGDVIVYQSGHSLIVHRVIAMNGNTVLTKGDANSAEDMPFDRSAVRGTVYFSIPYLGYVVQAVKTPVGVLLIMGAALLLLELSFCADKEEKEREIEKLKAEIRNLKEGMEETSEAGGEHRR